MKTESEPPGTPPRSLIILAHPRPGSFNHALAERVRHTLIEAGHQVSLRDLYAEGFDPLYPATELARDASLPAPLREHADLVARADLIVIIHPNWWGQPPAILKGWLDRVLRPGEAYCFGTDAHGQGIVIGLLKARAALVLTTSNTPPEAERALYGDPLDNLWKRCVFGFCGVQHVDRLNFGPVITSTESDRAGWLTQVREHLISQLC